MACAATLKRSLEFDPLHSPSHSGAKRRRCMPMTLTPSTPPTRLNTSVFSPFAGVVRKLTTEEITASISQEVRRLQKRRQLHYASPSQGTSQMSTAISQEKPEDSPSCSSPEVSPHMSQALSSILSSLPQNKKDAPLFTFRQVTLICERLVHEREEEVKEQYDKILNCKLAEQYESFLKFNHDQLQRRFGHCEMSYVS